MPQFHVCNHQVEVASRLFKVARLRNEYHEQIANPAAFITLLKDEPAIAADVFTFVQSVPDRDPYYKDEYVLEWDYAAVLRVTTYEHWWKHQIKDKTRNMVRKAGKHGLEIRPVPFTDELVHGIKRIYDETPVRQGRRFPHYGKTFDAMKQAHATFLDRSEFIGAYHQDELVGFIKLVHGEGVSNLMQILSMLKHRDKAPTNALIAKAVERCAERRVPLLHYGSWSRRSMGDFKQHHAFERFAIPRYYVPLTLAGRIVLNCGLHRDLTARLPESCLDRLAVWRNKWNGFWHRDARSYGAVAQLAERRS